MFYVNGILAGLVSIAGSCYQVKDWAAVVIGSVAAYLYWMSDKLFFHFKIDDPLRTS